MCFISLSRRRSAFLSTIVIIDTRLYTFALFLRRTNKCHIYRTIYLITLRRIGSVYFFLKWLSLKFNESTITYRPCRFNKRAGAANQLKVTVLNDVKIAFDFTIRKLNERVE